MLLLFEALALGLPREGLIQILTSRYLRFPGPLGDRPWLLAQALRAAGVRSLRRPYTHPNETGELWDEQRKGEPTWGLVRLRTWLATQSPEDGSEPKPRQAHLRLVAEQADQALRELTSLPETAPLVDHCRSLHRLLVRLRFFERTAALPELPMSLGGEDFSRYVLAGVPGCYYFLGSAPPEKVDAAKNGGPALALTHTDAYFPIPEPTIKTGVLTMTATLLQAAAKK